MKLSFLFILIFANSIFELFSIELECEFRKLKFFPDNLKVISCTFYQTFTEPNTRISKITPEEFHINAIYINGSTINYMPQNLAQFFPDLFYLDVVNCKLLEIHKNDLENFKKLVRLDLSKNKLKIIEKDLFKENTELRYLWLHNNDFKFISAKSFDHLPKLDYINLRYNPCTNRFHRAEKKPQKMMEVLRDSYVSCFDKNHFSDEEKMSELMSETEEFLSQIKSMKNGNRSDQVISYDEKFEELSFTELHEKFQTCEENLENEKNLFDGNSANF
ncbi:hypothetical protein PVAND_015074 [Polypedilum vanderplanki]|uniref:Uncharacterized protein n=1 Tax=Polypedilum vanderplanki TaxID=319348 RepID=A0A9J6BBJ7_POLVA|nr:hypothetical protein PVAND_015074 [Polypedilum vanderplanki]